MGKSCGGVRCSEGRQKGKKSVFLIGIQRGRLAATVRAGEARFGLELDGEKLWRGQVFGGTRKERKVFLNRDSEGAFGSEARFGPELDGEKLWRGQVFGRAPERKEKCFFNRNSEGAFGSESAIRGGSFWTRIRWGKAVAGSGVRSQDGRKKGKKRVF